MINKQKNFSIKSWEYTFDGLIFKVLPDKILPLLALEIRHAETKEASFAVIDYKKNQLLFNGLGLEENWWVGLTALYEGKLFFHFFAGREYPEPTGLVVADAMSQALLWEKKDVYLEKVEAQGVLVSPLRKQGKELLLLDIKSGNELDKKDLVNFGRNHGQVANPLTFPSQYTEGTAYFETIAQFLKHKLGVEATHKIDYLEWNDYILLSYWEGKSNFLLSMSEKGEVLFHELLQENARNQLEETFFLINNYLVSIKNKQTIFINKLV
jgi:hypothetical protein